MIFRYTNPRALHDSVVNFIHLHLQRARFLFVRVQLLEEAASLVQNVTGMLRGHSFSQSNRSRKYVNPEARKAFNSLNSQLKTSSDQLLELRHHHHRRRRRHRFPNHTRMNSRTCLAAVKAKQSKLSGVFVCLILTNTTHKRRALRHQRKPLISHS